MPRYIDADKPIETNRALLEHAQMNGMYNHARIYERFVHSIEETPTADVVPKSEVDLYRKQVDELEDELASTYDKLEKAKVEVERMQAEKDALIKNYAECMKDYASEIFAEIEREIIAALRSNYSAKQERVEKQIPDDFVSYMCEGKIAALRGIDDFLAELKKKYIGGKR